MEETLCPAEVLPPVVPANAIVIRKVRGNWLTKKPNSKSSFVATFSVLLLAVASFGFWADVLDSSSWITAIPKNVYVLHEYWRPWTALFAHANLEHLLSNSILFYAFAYILYGHFGSLVFPVAAFLFGGLTNFIVLKTLPPEVSLLGASGVVYWMGAAWLTLYFCLESRDRIGRRALKALGVGAVLFIPETLQQNVSYLSHFVGFVLGIMFALVYYALNRKKFRCAEVIEYVVEEPEVY